MNEQISRTAKIIRLLPGGKRDSNRCWFLHKWEKWKVTSAGNVVSRYDGKSIIGRYIYQTRTCLTCGKVQMRSVEAR